MRLTLATSPHVRHPAVLEHEFLPHANLMYSFSPLGLLSLAAVLRRDRQEIEWTLYDVNRRTMSGALSLDGGYYDSVATEICETSPDIVGFMTECDSYHHVLQVAECLRRRQPDIGIVLGGPHASAVARATLDRCVAVDAVVVGEGERTFPELLDTWDGRTFAAVAGALVRAGNTVVDGGPRGLVEHLDDLPIPAYDCYQPDPGEEIFVEAGRGCPFQCTFCSTAPYWRRRHRTKSPQRIVEEVLWLKRIFGTDRVHFTHDLFTTRRDWVLEVCEALLGAGVPVRWTCSARTDTVDPELLATMAQAGCRAIYFGLESGSTRILKEIRKDIPLQQSFAVVAECLVHGITPNVGFIAGLPGEDEASLGDTLDAYEQALRLGCRPAHIFGYCPFAGSQVYPEIGRMECSGHFLDLPLGTVADIANRRRIQEDQDLYGAYFRPNRAHLDLSTRQALEGIDEFSSLVESVLMPTVALAGGSGGLRLVHRRWATWIRERNRARHAPECRAGYGSARDFADFVIEQLTQSDEMGHGLGERARSAAVAVARAIRKNLEVAARVSAGALSGSTTMDTHRSLRVPEVNGARELHLGAVLARGAIVDSLEVPFDVIAAMAGQGPVDPADRATYLLWQLTSSGDVRLLSVDETVYRAVECLRSGDATVGEILVRSLRLTGSAPAGGDPAPLDIDTQLALLGKAIEQGVLTHGATEWH